MLPGRIPAALAAYHNLFSASSPTMTSMRLVCARCVEILGYFPLVYIVPSSRGEMGHKLLSRMPLNLHWHIQLLEILLLVFGQFLAPRLQCFIHPCDTRKPNNRTRDALVNPCQRYMAHLPAMLLGQLLDTPDDLLINVAVPREASTIFLLAFRPCGAAKGRGRTCKMTAAERCPLPTSSEFEAHLNQCILHEHSPG